MTVEPVRCAIIGCGMIAHSGYAPRCRAYPHLIALHGFYDRDPAQARKLADACGGGVVYDSVEAALADPAIEAVINVTTLDGHFPVTLAALRAGKHVFSEKPLAGTVAETDQLIREAEARSLTLACAPSSVLGAEQQDVWARIRAGELGTPHAVIGSFAGGRVEYWHPNADVFMTTGVSVVGDATPYPLSVMLTFFGPVARVFGMATNLEPERVLQVGPRAGLRFTPTIPDHVMGMLEFANGMKGMLYAGWCGQTTFPRLEIQGTKGAFLLNPHNDGEGAKFLPSHGHDNTVALPVPAKAFTGWLDWGKGPADFCDAIRRKRPARCSPYLARHIVEIAEQLNVASRTRAMVPMRTTFAQPEPVGAVAPWELPGAAAAG